MIVGDRILQRKLVTANPENLNHSCYNITVGQIIPADKADLERRFKQGGLDRYLIEPREMVWVLSRETFSLPHDVTGLLTLRPSFTKRGLLTLNTGIVDPFYDGPISAVLINFSDLPREIKTGDYFMRCNFFEHESVETWRPRNDHDQLVHFDNPYAKYESDVENRAQTEFSKNFLNIQEFDDSLLSVTFEKLLVSWIKKNPVKVIAIALTLGAMFVQFGAAAMEFVGLIDTAPDKTILERLLGSLTGS